MAATSPYPDVLPGPLIAVTAVAAEPVEPFGHRQTMSFGDPVRSADVHTSELLFSVDRRLSGESVESVDSLCGQAHSQPRPLVNKAIVMPCVSRGERVPGNYFPVDG
mgnify:CR=1 FL=1